MYRLMSASDLTGIQSLWEEGRECSAEFAVKAVRQLAGERNVYVAEEGGRVEAVVLAIPVEIKEKKGCYLYGLCAGSKSIAAALVEYAVEEQSGRGKRFFVALPSARFPLAFFERMGFVSACPRRCLKKDIRRNLWSQAEFDVVTARMLCDLRKKFCPAGALLKPEQMATILGELYSRGATIVTNEGGYGLYFCKDSTLYFVELMAESDRAADVLLEAARSKEIIAEQAVLKLEEEQLLFVGEGRREESCVVRFAGEPFDIEEGYLGLLLEI